LIDSSTSKERSKEIGESFISSDLLDDPPFHTHHGPLDNRDAIVLVEGDQGTPDFAAEGHKLPDDRSVPIA
jgi:hypothetical protein